MLMNTPAANLVTVLSGVLTKFMGVLEAIKQQKEG
jgi:hypothetical protein